MPVLSCLRPAADAPVAMEDEDEYPTARRARAFSRLVDAPAHDTSDFAILPYDVICHVLRFALAERGGYARLCALSRASRRLLILHTYTYTQPRLARRLLGERRLRPRGARL